MAGFLLIVCMPFFLDSLQRWPAAGPGSRWLVMVALALAVLFGTTAGVHEDIEDATQELVVADELDFEPVKAKTAQKKAVKATPDKRGCGGDKLDLPQGVFARATPFHPALARAEQPHEPLSRRPLLPQPERLLRPPNA